MSVAYDNLVYQFSATQGTGNLTLQAMSSDSPAQGFRNFSDVFGTGSSAKFYYAIRNRTQNPTEYEVGIGHMSDATTLVRDVVLESSNSNNLVSFSAGSKDVISDVPAAFQIDKSTLYGYTAVSGAGTYTMLLTDCLIEITSGSPTINLVKASTYTGPDVRIKNSGAGAPLVNCFAGDTMDGNASFTFDQQYRNIAINSNGTNWVLL